MTRRLLDSPKQGYSTPEPWACTPITQVQPQQEPAEPAGKTPEEGSALLSALTCDDGLHEESEHGEHGQAAVLDLLDLELGEGVRVVSQAQGVEGATCSMSHHALSTAGHCSTDAPDLARACLPLMNSKAVDASGPLQSRRGDFICQQGLMSGFRGSCSWQSCVGRAYRGRGCPDPPVLGPHQLRGMTQLLP